MFECALLFFTLLFAGWVVIVPLLLLLQVLAFLGGLVWEGVREFRSKKTCVPCVQRRRLAD